MDRPRADNNIVLTGFMGTGKTTVGRAIAARTGLRFVDTDDLIVSTHGPIPEIFATRGEQAFRAMEREVATDLALQRGLVISTGGRTLLDTEIAGILGTHARVFCLTASIETILERVMGDDPGSRPLLAGPDPRERVLALLEERAPQYAAFEQVTTDGRAPDEIAADIIERCAISTGWVAGADPPSP